MLFLSSFFCFSCSFAARKISQETENSNDALKCVKCVLRSGFWNLLRAQTGVCSFNSLTRFFALFSFQNFNYESAFLHYPANCLLFVDGFLNSTVNAASICFCFKMRSMGIEDERKRRKKWWKEENLGTIFD